MAALSVYIPEKLKARMDLISSGRGCGRPRGSIMWSNVAQDAFRAFVVAYEHSDPPFSYPPWLPAPSDPPPFPYPPWLPDSETTDAHPD
jgi:hypothetical protein